MGIPPENIFIGENGHVFELDGVSVKTGEIVPSGRILVDGLGVGDVGSIVLRDRKHLGEDGLIVVVTTIDGTNGQIVAGPDIISRGFVYVREAEAVSYTHLDVYKRQSTDSIRIPEVSMDIFSVMARISGENPSARKEYINAAVRVSVTK